MKNKKGLIAIICLAIGLISSSGSAAATQPTPGIVVNGKSIQTDVPPITQNGRVLVPLRAVAESLGAVVSWDPKSSMVTISKYTYQIELRPGEKQVSIHYAEGNTGTETLDVPAISLHNRIYVPLRFIASQFNYKVEWRDRTVLIHSFLTDSEMLIVNEGDLDSARQLMTEVGGGFFPYYMQKPLEKSHPHGDYGITFIFPEGEVFRWFMISGNTVTYYQLIDGDLVATWQVHLQNDNYTDSLQEFVGGKFKDAWGEQPVMNETYMFYLIGVTVDSIWTQNGRINSDHTIMEIGYKLLGDSGVLDMELPDEKRTDAIHQS